MLFEEIYKITLIQQN